MKNLTPEEKEIGKENFYNVLGVTRREFLAGTVLAGATSGLGLGSMYFGYKHSDNTPTTGLKDPVRVGWIGTGDEGGVLISNHTPSFINIKAIADIRPYNIHRAFHGDRSTDNAYAARKGLMYKYDWKTEAQAREHVKVYDASNGGYEALLKDPDIEAVVIALPLHLHAPVAIAAMRMGKHVLTEKLMGHTVHACKEMAMVAKETGKYLAVGHQRHYSILYDNAVDTIKRGILGTVHSIRAQWHRNNLPFPDGIDSWQPPVPLHAGSSAGDKKHWNDIAANIKKLNEELKKPKLATQAELARIEKQIAQWTAQLTDATVNAKDFGYQDGKTKGGYEYPAIEELIRWRIFGRTGGGLMAELGSHQLDAAGIFASAARNDGTKVHPLSVTAMGGRYIFPPDRDCEDHVYCMFEYPGAGYDADKSPEKKIALTYSSINGNEFGGYGEVVMGTKGTMILEKEADVAIYSKGDASTKLGVKKDDKDKYVIDTTSSGSSATAKLAIEGDGKPISRGYTEELEHWAWCIRNPSESMDPDKDPEHFPRCHPKVAMADAVIALTTNIAMTAPANRNNKELNHPNHIEFKPSWFDINSNDTPEGIAPDLSRYKSKA